jgi:hypothetical protein
MMRVNGRRPSVIGHFTDCGGELILPATDDGRRTTDDYPTTAR